MVARLRGFIIGVLLALALIRTAASEAAEIPPAERIVVLVGMDGFRWDYLDKFQPPNLTKLAKEGARAERMIPSFPSLTFPNFYTLATGLRPEHHGIIGNNMFDPEMKAFFSLGSASVSDGRWWGGEPIWVTAQKQGRRAACMFWPGSEAEIGGVRPDEWRKFDGDVTPTQRVQTVLEWLNRPADTRPQLVTLYFHEADSAGHHTGPDSEETAAAVREVDTAIGTLLAGIEAQPELAARTNFVFVADHGMTPISPDRVISLRQLLGERAGQIDFSGAVAGLRPPAGTEEEVLATLRAQPHLQAYRREEIPARLHFRDHRRIPPIVIIADEGWQVSKNPPPPPDSEDRARFYKATHGFDPELTSMHATFVAWGPAIRAGVTVPPFENIHVYPLLCSLLGLKPAACDGDEQLAVKVLKP